MIFDSCLMHILMSGMRATTTNTKISTAPIHVSCGTASTALTVGALLSGKTGSKKWLRMDLVAVLSWKQFVTDLEL